MAASFQAAVVDQLVDKLVAAADAADAPHPGDRRRASPRTRRSAPGSQEVAAATGRRAFLPPSDLCTDNAAMIAAAAWWRLRSDGPTPLDTGVDPGLRACRPWADPESAGPACSGWGTRVSWSVSTRPYRVPATDPP